MGKRQLGRQTCKRANYFDNNRSVTRAFANGNGLGRKYGQNEARSQTPENKNVTSIRILIPLFFLFFSLPSIPNGGAFATQRRHHQAPIGARLAAKRGAKSAQSAQAVAKITRKTVTRHFKHTIMTPNARILQDTLFTPFY